MLRVTADFTLHAATSAQHRTLLLPLLIESGTAPCSRLLLISHAATSTARIQGSWSLKSLVKEGVTCHSVIPRLTTADPHTSSTPYYFLKPWTSVNKTSYWAASSAYRTAIYIGERLHLYAPAPSRVRIRPYLTMDQLPHVFVSSRTPLVLEFPCGLELEPVILKTGYALPVGRFLVGSPRSL